MSQRFFSIRELMELVFNFLDFDSNARNAQVCKFWSEIALDLLWQNVDQFGRLLNLLASTQVVGHRLILQRSITLDDWRRFSHYAHRIRRLCLDDEPGASQSRSTTTVCLDALQEIARTRVTFKILPNLRSLTWLAKDTERRKLSVLFMHDGVTHYTTYAGPSSIHHTDASRRMPFVTYLDLRLFDNQVQNIVEVASEFSNLKEITLSQYQLTSNVMEGLAKLKNLEKVELSSDDKRSCLGTRETLAQFSPQLEVGAFPRLTTLHFILHITDATRFFQSPHFPPNLTVIRINALSVPDQKAMHGFFTALSSNYPNFQDLNFECIPYEDFEPSSSHSWTIDTIRPLFKCSQLSSLRVIHHSPISLTTEDLIEISKTWSSTIETLQLNPEPFINSPMAQSSLTLSSLFPFAFNCPKLQHLGLYINATIADLPAVPTRFTSLKCLYVGASSIGAPAEVARFLSHLCPPGCKINEEIFWADRNTERSPEISSETSEALEAWAAKWGEVGLLLPALIGATVDNITTIRSLEERVRELEMEAQRLRAMVNNP